MLAGKGHCMHKFLFLQNYLWFNKYGARDNKYGPEIISTGSDSVSTGPDFNKYGARDNFGKKYLCNVLSQPPYVTVDTL
jgi:hypothetical protein